MVLANVIGNSVVICGKEKNINWKKWEDTTRWRRKCSVLWSGQGRSQREGDI